MIYAQCGWQTWLCNSYSGEEIFIYLLIRKDKSSSRLNSLLAFVTRRNDCENAIFHTLWDILHFPSENPAQIMNISNISVNSHSLILTYVHLWIAMFTLTSNSVGLSSENNPLNSTILELIPIKTVADLTVVLCDSVSDMATEATKSIGAHKLIQPITNHRFNWW